MNKLNNIFTEIPVFWRFFHFQLSNDDLLIRIHKRQLNAISNRSQSYFCFSWIHQFRKLEAHEITMTAKNQCREQLINWFKLIDYERFSWSLLYQLIMFNRRSINSLQISHCPTRTKMISEYGAHIYAMSCNSRVAHFSNRRNGKQSRKGGA